MAVITESKVRAVLFDRDGTLVYPVPYCGDPDLIAPISGAIEAVARAREAGLAVGVVTNQGDIGHGWLPEEQVFDVNQRIDEMFGGFDVWCVCPHVPGEDCDCRMPKTGLICEAADRLKVAPEECAVIGDAVIDVETAHTAGALGILVPNKETTPDEAIEVASTADSILDAVDLVTKRAFRNG